jgi:hypothetical protein
MSEAVYVVQQQEQIDYEPDEPFTAWRDIATVTVPARTHRKTVIEKGLLAANVVIDGPLIVRVLDEGSARETKVETEQPPPRLKLT